jgi:hypothetical protein
VNADENHWKQKVRWKELCRRMLAYFCTVSVER